MNDTTKAVVATVDLGFEKIEGLMLPNGDYGVAIPQIAKSFCINQNTASRDLKRLLGDDFRPSKIKTELGNQSINVVTLEGFAKIIRALDRKGNTIANAFIDAILQEGLERRFDRAFGKKVDEDERNQLIALRMKRIMARKLWTDVLRDRSLELFGIKPSPNDYKQWTIKVNERLFNRRHFECDRDNMQKFEQETIELFERMAERKAKTHKMATPDDLVEMAINSFE
jgi:hypothetical protein